VIAAGIAVAGEAYGCEAIMFGLFAGRGGAAVDAQDRHPLVPAAAFIVVEQLCPRQLMGRPS
jgi:hypothetical protein